MGRKGSPASSRWNRKDVLAAILRRSAKGLPMHLEAVRRDDGALAHAGRTRYASWGDALRAAGLDPVEIRYGARWSARKVIRAILERSAVGASLGCRDVRRDATSLANAATYYFGNWGEALKAAGIDPAACRAFLAWTESRIISEIRRDAGAGLPLNSVAVRRRKPKLVSAARRHFGGWDDALRAAGLEPLQCRRHGKPYTRESVVETICRRHADGEGVNANAICPRSVLRAGIRLFGSWDDALLAAGLDPANVRKASPPHTAEKVIEAIRARAGRGEPLHATAAREADSRLYRAARLVFGSWPQALDEAGLDGSRIERKKIKWTRLKIVETLLWRHEAGMPLNVGVILDVVPYTAIQREFGTYPDALREAGIAPDHVYQTDRWSSEIVIARIRERHQAGRALHATAVKREAPHLLTSARHHFDAWAAALIEAGLDPDRHRLGKPRWTPGTVKACLRALTRNGQAASRQQAIPESLAKAAQRIFGSWQAALDAARQ